MPGIWTDSIAANRYSGAAAIADIDNQSANKYSYGAMRIEHRYSGEDNRFKKLKAKFEQLLDLSDWPGESDQSTHRTDADLNAMDQITYTYNAYFYKALAFDGQSKCRRNLDIREGECELRKPQLTFVLLNPGPDIKSFRS